MQNTKALDGLVGYKIVGWQDADQDDYTSAQALILRKGNSITAAFILQDEEGNGPGHLDLQKVDAPTAKKIIAELAAKKQRPKPHTNYAPVPSGTAVISFKDEDEVRGQIVGPVIALDKNGHTIRDFGWHPLQHARKLAETAGVEFREV
jgi:hypothetical protein